MLTASALFLMTAATAHAASYRWIEAEKPILTNFPANPFAPADAREKSLLSGGDWIGASGKRASPLYAVYDVDIAVAGEYRLYVRKFWKHGPYRVQFNNGPWIDVGADIALLDEGELHKNLVVNWTSAGAVTLPAGRNRFRIESTANEGAIAFDCFLLTDGAFAARGLAKPDERLTSAEPGWFAWDPPAGDVDSAIDLRPLNERFAGENGRIVARDGRLVHEKTGEPVRFWGVNVGPDILRLDERDLDHLAKLLATHGVNWVRIHGPIYVTEGATLGEIDRPQLERTLRAVQVFKRAGIYSTLSIYFPSWLKLGTKNGWPAYRDQTPFALLFFDARFQAMYRDWWKALLTTPDASTGIRLADEPAVLSVEMLNEDSLFFWTFQPRKTIPPEVSAQLEQRFGRWLANRYGSIEAATKRWPSRRVDGDDFANGRVGVIEAGQLEAMRNDARGRDTARFLYEVERDLYADTSRYLREALGARCLISASNWTTASDAYLTPVERAANLFGDFIDRHAYYNAPHEGERAGYRISVGDTFGDRSALRFDPQKPGGNPSPWNPLFDIGYGQKPTMISELDWLEPNRFRAEAPLLCAAMASGQDVDALGFFAATGPTWEPTISKFSTLSPVALAQWPAAALIYRRGLIDELPIIADQRLNLDELLDLGGVRGVDAKARFVGRSQWLIGDAPTSRPSVDVSAFVNEGEKTIRSESGQLTLDYGRGVLTLNAPKVKAVVGFLNTMDRPSDLGTLSIRSPMEYGAIAVVALDDQPISTSRRLLVQVMSEQHNAGFAAGGSELKTIRSIGQSPILVREFAGRIEFTDGSRWRAQALDQNDHPLGPALEASSTLEIRPTIVHYVLTRE